MNAINMSYHASHIFPQDSIYSLYMPGNGEAVIYYKSQYCIVDKPFLRKYNSVLKSKDGNINLPFWGYINNYPAWSNDSYHIYYHSNDTFSSYVFISDYIPLRDKYGYYDTFLQNTLGMSFPAPYYYKCFKGAENGYNADWEEVDLTLNFSFHYCTDNQELSGEEEGDYTFYFRDLLYLEDKDSSYTFTLKRTEEKPSIKWVLDTSKPHNGYAGLYIPTEKSGETSCRLVGSKEYSFKAEDVIYKVHEITPPSISYTHYLVGNNCVCYTKGGSWTLIITKNEKKYKWVKESYTVPWQDKEVFKPVKETEADNRQNIEKFKWCGMFPYVYNSYVNYLEIANGFNE